MTDPKYEKMMEAGDMAAEEVTTVDMDEAAILQQQYRLPASYGKSLVASCFVSTCCCWLLGGIAFILALFGQKSAFAGDVKEARRLKKASYVVSVIGFVVGLAILIVFTIHVVNFMKTLYQARGFDPSLLPPPSFTFNTPP